MTAGTALAIGTFEEPQRKLGCMCKLRGMLRIKRIKIVLVVRWNGLRGVIRVHQFLGTH